MFEVATEKVCKRCGEVKSLSDFYKQPRNRDGHWTYCKACASVENAARYSRDFDKVAAISKASYAKNREAILLRNKEYYELTKDAALARMKSYRLDNPEKMKEQYTATYARHKEKICAATKLYRELNPKKKAAHQDVRIGIRNGKLIKGVCEVCGSEDVQGHHSDYDKPMEVMWLCSGHHAMWHVEHGEGANAHN